MNLEVLIEAVREEFASTTTHTDGPADNLHILGYSILLATLTTVDRLVRTDKQPLEILRDILAAGKPMRYPLGEIDRGFALGAIQTIIAWTIIEHLTSTEPVMTAESNRRSAND